MWAFEPEVVTAIARDHENPLYLPGVALDPAIRATAEPAEFAGCEALIVVVPAQHLRRVLRRFAPVWRAGLPAVLCAKGIEQGTCALMSEVLAEEIPAAVPAVLSGPTFAIEVARDLPTAVTVACANEEVGAALCGALGNRHFRIYQSADVVGAQIGGAVKNVLAIACGIVEGRGMGDNARAALITRGMAEIVRLGVAKGAAPATLMGLCGLGDLTLTCNARQSRNFSTGIALGRGEALAAVLGAPPLDRRGRLLGRLGGPRWPPVWGSRCRSRRRSTASSTAAPTSMPRSGRCSPVRSSPRHPSAVHKETAMAYWLVKSEPSAWSWEDHVRVGVEPWNGVRNFQAARNMKAMRLGDRAFFYHSVDEKRIVGILDVVGLYRKDPTDETGRFGLVDFKAVKPVPNPVTLAALKAEPRLQHLKLVRQSRLSVVPIDDEAWRLICEMGGVEA